MKSIFASKTVWANIISLAATVATAKGLSYAPILADPETQALAVGGVTAVVNIALRLVTKEPVKVL